MSNKFPLISVIMPAYNVENYLSEAVDSILAQTIGFHENIELIIVNDGSTDRTELIALDYAAKYPDNVIYVKQKNQGLSATRRNGFLKARGEFIHSMDSDDTISKNFYEEAVKFFREHAGEVDIVASKLILFEARQGGHYLNYRFKKTRVINIDKEQTAYQYHIASCVIRRGAVQKEWFDKKISIAEDARLIAIILKQKRAYGVVSNIAYNYRIREAGGSMINTQHLNRDFYTETPQRFWQYILDFWRESDGSVIPYIQNFILNDIQWRLNEQKEQKVLTKTEEDNYKKTVYGIISQLDDAIILNQERTGLHKRIYLLKKKYGKKFNNKLRFSSGKYYVDKRLVLNLAEHTSYLGVVFDFIHTKGEGRYFIEGYSTNDLIHSDDRLVIKTSKGEFPLKYVERAQRRKDAFLGDTFHTQEAFEVDIETDNEDTIKAILKTFSGETIQVPIFTKRHTRLGALNKSYHRIADVILRKENHRIYIKPYTQSRHIWYEVTFLFYVIKNLRLGDTYRMVKEAVVNLRDRDLTQQPFKEIIIGFLKPPAFLARNIVLNFYSALIRLLYHLRAKRTSRPIWIVTDRGIAAGDNGEAFFRYLASLKNPPVQFYFAINQGSPDINRLREIGPVVRMDSLAYKLLFLRASKIISSQADEYIINPFGARESHMVDLFRFDFVFLQHGVTKNDISDWLNRFFKNIKLFVTAAEREYSSILEYPFYYTKNEVLLSGFPRYDRLLNEPINKIILAPTWRKYLTAGVVGKGGKWEYESGFIRSDYYKFYNSLMNDPRIINALKNANAIGEFYLHPSHAVHVKDFQGNDIFKLKEFPYDYATALKQGSLLITDYSSVYFDFSYLNKPVIYTQFDHEFYYENHGVYKQGYFSEEADGFGPVCYDYETAVEEIIKSIQNNFKLEEQYQKRINDFFAYHDRNNSKRVYEALLKMQ